nr:MAG TPA: hypothetical protein [Caudoviricetes sp.]
MSKFVEDNIRYILVRKISDDIEQVATIDDYNGNIYWSESVDRASRFESLENAKKLMELQKQLSVLLGKEFKFEILEEQKTVIEAK